MQSLKDLKYGRELDLLLFNGVPETQAHLYGQEFQSNYEMRDRFGISKSKIKKTKAKSMQKVSRRLVLDSKTNKLSIIRVENSPDSEKLGGIVE